MPARQVRNAILAALSVAGVAAADDQPKDYVGPFPTTALYRMCADQGATNAVPICKA